MSYRSDVKIGVKFNDFKDFMTNLHDLENMKNFCVYNNYDCSKARQYQKEVLNLIDYAEKGVRRLGGEEYQTLYWEYISWADGNFISKYVEDELIDKYDSNFVRVGEDPEDIEREFGLDVMLFDVSRKIADYDF